ncbi:hypothetical protein CEXT_375771 [Caerostris extrusa]|uniref:Uncharacterized protein n=1 Tax=Caerostris extrusa TaxID=172846 RepID=A0AAV4QPV0_CAEEX|nr:hypothetical protein CEXT_375771 [Caerostris extrusa]
MPPKFRMSRHGAALEDYTLLTSSLDQHNNILIYEFTVFIFCISTGTRFTSFEEFRAKLPSAIFCKSTGTRFTSFEGFRTSFPMLSSR